MNNLCLEVRDGNGGNGAMADIWGCANEASKLWAFNGNGPIRSDLGKCLDIVAANKGVGAGVNMVDYHDDWRAQQWRWDGSQIISKLSGLCLQISAANRDVGAAVEVWGRNGGGHQQWHPVV
ncbi:RICIN domain-containing protein [Actinomadura roseirufa]|uniref:RICIN domain-containing protein n=1 Tax=Actinomadura roseirufa TaxID=2094049 RepID=UPI0013F15235|nr:RICIN domain-containing protein [Actinomadura roseirufa]